jgi:hypothetical protein
MVIEGSLQSSDEPATGLYPESDESNPHNPPVLLEDMGPQFDRDGMLTCAPIIVKLDYSH